MPGHCPNHGPYDGDVCPFPPPHGYERYPISPLQSGEEPTEIPQKRRSGFLDDEAKINPEQESKYRTESKNYNLRIFVSSTFEDLKEYREVVFKAIHSMMGYADDMLFWSADERDALSASLDRVRQCDLVILLIAHKYGYIPPDQKYSITELEYRAAKQASIPVLAFLVDEKAPWLKAHIEFEKQDELKKFRKLVETDLIRKSFTTTDDLHASVIQSLHHFIERHRRNSQEERKFRGTVLTKSQIELTISPDAVIQIGKSEDGLPLLINIRRSGNISPYINAIADIILSSPRDDVGNELLDSFRDQLEKHASSSWTKRNIFSVRMKDGTKKKMYVTHKNLSQITSSLLSNILESSKSKVAKNGVSKQSERYDDDGATDLGNFNPATPKSNDEHLQSAGGSNRFLGISIDSGETFSVGKRLNEMVEWHPFYVESIAYNLAGYRFKVEGYDNIDPSVYEEFLKEKAYNSVDDRGFCNTEIKLVISRQSIGHLLVEIAKSVEKHHSKGNIHGDLKPKNILLTKKGIVLIDDFNLKPGDRSPGWTPNWSSPEQVLQEPLTYAADIYSLGLLIVSLIGGKLVGEVRKFKIPTHRNPDKEHDVFYNPSLNIERSYISPQGESKWISFLRSCLEFDCSKRPQTAIAFSRQLENLLKSYPLNGDIQLELDNGQLVVATLLDGSKKVSRMISDYKE